MPTERPDRFEVRLSPEESERLQALADDEDVSRNNMVRRLINAAHAEKNIASAKATTRAIRKSSGR